MARPLRIEFEGALYHVTSRGNARESIFFADCDREVCLKTLAEVVDRYSWICHAYCLMTNHYHVVIETPNANLSRGMSHLNGVYTHRTNREHLRCGHLLQGRFKSVIVEKESHLLELARYVVLTPRVSRDGALCEGLAPEQLSRNIGPIGSPRLPHDRVAPHAVRPRCIARAAGLPQVLPAGPRNRDLG